MTHKKGFSLVFFLLYLTMFSIITFLMCHVTVTLIIPSIFSLRKNQSIISLHTATDFFVRDIKMLQNNNHLWNVIKPNEIIWQIDRHNIGWSFTQDRLERKEGIYNGAWKEVKTSIITKGLLESTFIYENNENGLVGIELALVSEYAPKKPVICYVSLKKQETNEKIH